MNATTSSTSRTADVAAIVAVVVAQETWFNAKDAEIFAAPWRDRSWAVSAVGREIAGRAAVLDAAEVGLSACRGRGVTKVTADRGTFRNGRSVVTVDRANSLENVYRNRGAWVPCPSR